MSVQAGDVLSYSYTGSYQSVTLPPGRYKLECWGAQGGSYSSSYYGGKGGYSVGTIEVKKSTVFYIYVGGQGTSVTGSSSGGSGGYNGGAQGGNGSSSSYGYGGSGGGGGSDIRVGSNSLYARVIVAGGGGGNGGPGCGGGLSLSSSTATAGGYGGGANGTAGNNSTGTSYGGYGGSYGKPTSGGSGGSVTSNSTTSNDNTYYAGGGGGAGGGWYGGGGGGGGSLTTTSLRGNSGSSGSFGSGGRGGNSYSSGGRAYYGSGGGAGGGGSGYVYTSTTAGQYPSGCLLNADYYLESANTYAGNTTFTDFSGSSVTGHAGNGNVRITVISVQSGVTIFIKTGDRYTQLEYIESGGNSYFDTGIYPDQSTYVKMVAQATVSGTYPFFGARSSSSKTDALIFWMIKNTSEFRFRADYGTQTVSQAVADPLKKYMIGKASGNSLFVFQDQDTRESVSLTPNTETFTSNSSLCFFGCKTNNEMDTRMLSGKLFSAEVQTVIKSDGLPMSVILYYTPARSPSGEVGLYVSHGPNGTFLKANNDGFQAGPEVGYIDNTSWQKGTKALIKTANGWKEIKNAFIKEPSGWIKG